MAKMFGRRAGWKVQRGEIQPPKISLIWGPLAALPRIEREELNLLLRLVFTFPHLQTNMGNCGKFQWPWSLVQRLKITTSLLPCKFPAGQTSWSGGSCQTRAKGIPSKFPGTPWPGWKWNFQGISLFSLRFWIGLGFFLFQWRWFCQASKQQDFRIVNFIVNLTTLLKLCLLNPGFMDTFQEIFQNHSLPLLPVCFQHFFPQDGPDFFL